jgi:hypothetical protein
LNSQVLRSEFNKLKVSNKLQSSQTRQELKLISNEIKVEDFIEGKLSLEARANSLDQQTLLQHPEPMIKDDQFNNFNKDSTINNA